MFHVKRFFIGKTTSYYINLVNSKPTTKPSFSFKKSFVSRYMWYIMI